MSAHGKKVLVAMSGGVDSSVTAALLKADGYEVVGCFMRLGSEDSLEAADGYDNVREENGAACAAPGTGQTSGGASGGGRKQGCCSVNDAGDARLVAAILDVPFYVMNFKKDFGRIINYFVDEYNAGRTPNPCVRCNDWLKFGKLHQYAQSIDCDFVASGHYARITRPGDADHPADHAGPALQRGLDVGKDQSYVLFGSPRDRLAHMLLPIGAMQKSAVRQVADDFKLPVFNKPDSQEICFVPDQDYARLVERRTPGGFQRGDIVDRNGQKIGQHDGQQHFTLGQRRGVGVALGYPIYVVDKNPATNTVTVGSREELFADGLEASQTNWLVDHRPADWQSCEVKVRYNSPPTPGRVRFLGPDTLDVALDEPVAAVTPGQAVVCYGGNQVLGGGWIDTVRRCATS